MLDDREKKNGTKLDRKIKPVPVVIEGHTAMTVRVQYVVAILCALVAAYAAWKAQGVSTDALHSGNQALSAAHNAKQSANSVRQLASQISSTATLAQMTAARVAADENRTCRIQSRGLPAGHALSGVMYDLSAVLTHVPLPNHPTQLERRNRRLLIALRHKATKYVRIERHQPPTRHC